MSTEITVICTNPEAMRLQVTAEMTVGEWENVLRTIEGTKYYAPLADLMGAISRGINAIKDRQPVEYQSRVS